MISSEHANAIAALDLDPIKVKLMHRQSGEGWNLAHANAVEAEYRRFLILMKQYPQEPVAPSNDVDTFWHYHILDTMKYAADCDAVFGHFLHHFPYMGLRGEDDEQAHQDAGERMRELYRTTFGSNPVRLSDTRGANTARDANGVAFSITPPDGERHHTPDRTAFSITPRERVAAQRAPDDAAFSITPRDRWTGHGEPDGAAFSITPPDGDRRVSAGRTRFTLQRPTLAAA